MTLITAQNAFDELPSNTAAMIGQNVTLNCSLSKPAFPLSWIKQKVDTVYDEESGGIQAGFEEDYAVEENGNSRNLVVINSDPRDFDHGQYTCKHGTLQSSAHAEVIILGNVVY